MKNLKLDYIVNHPKYIDQIVSWYKIHWGKINSNCTTSKWKEKVFLSIDKIPITLIAIDTSHNTPILTGTISLYYNGLKDYPKESVWLSLLYVDPKYRNLGVGSILTNFATKEARKLGISELFLYTYTNGLIYKKLGWETIETKNINDKHSLVMQKYLK